ncbi:MAG TPA: mannonate dehydratase, partial [Mucilaginibacter sp.]|nr:mannonate dehydratase [Mucilaginibacter sp.]
MFSNLEQTFRWYGPADPVTLKAISQAGATGVVTALHHIPAGEVWSTEEIEKRKHIIEAAGLRWSVVESVNVHESIKTASQDRERYAEKYIETLKNLSKSGIKIVCYNFMPVLDWTRTDIDYRLPNGASALRFHASALAAFDLYILEREGAYSEFSQDQQEKARAYLDSINANEKERLIRNVMAGLPGTKDVLTIDQFKSYLEKYRGIDAAKLKKNLNWFLQTVVPEAEKAGVKLCIHPDDPPFPIFGLPRVVSKEEDLEDVVNAYPSTSNGLTFCTGSLGVRGDNDLPGMIDRLGTHIHFLHLRNVKREADGSFYEDNHLEGSSDMYTIVKSVVREQKRREDSGRDDAAIPMRPDHGHKLLDDFNYETFPGYSAIGRLK